MSSLDRFFAALLLPVLVASCGASWVRDAPHDPGIPVRFVYVDAGATRVCVSGSFNQWSLNSHCLQREGSTWTITIPLPAGRWEYGFYVDGESWKTDPGVPLTEDNGFGRANSVLIVE